MNALRKDLHAINADGTAASLMVGAGETYFGAFVLALSANQFAAGLVSSVPMFAGALLQLASPYLVRRIGSYRVWVVTCASLQAASFLPLILAAWFGRMSTLLVFGVVAVYWATGLGAGAAWNAWVESLVPARVRTRFFARRTRLAQLGLLVGFVLAGIALQLGSFSERTFLAFAVVFLAAALCRIVSACHLASQGEPAPPGAEFVPHFRRALAALREGVSGKVLLYLLVVQVGVQVSGPFFTPFMLKRLTLSYGAYMVLISVAMVAKIACLPWLGRLVDRFGARRVLWGSALAITPMSALWCVSHQYAYLVAVQLVSGVAWAGFELASLLLYFDTIPRRERVSVLTLFNVGNAAAYVVGSLGGAAILAHLGTTVLGYHAVFLVSGALRVAALVLVFRIPAESGTRAAIGYASSRAIPRPHYAKVAPELVPVPGVAAIPASVSTAEMDGEPRHAVEHAVAG